MPDLDKLVQATAIVSCRVSGLMLFAPFFGSASLPRSIKAGMAMTLIWLLWPLALARGAGSASPGNWFLFIIGEFAVGLFLGISVQLVFEAALLAGQTLGIQMGFSLVHILDPQSQADTPVLSLFYQSVVMLLFLAMDIPEFIIRSVANSYRYLPAGNVVIREAAVETLLSESGAVFFAGIQLAAPILAATMLADIALGFLGKAAPQLPILFVGLSIKSLLGMLLLTAVIATWPQWFESSFALAVHHGEQLLHLCR
jgi:flagellar biosynthetic protein FliR